MDHFGEILQSIGDFGLLQMLLIGGLTFQNFLMSIFLSSLLFIQSDPERHCNTDWILGADPNLTSAEQLNLTLPREQDGSFSRCRMFVPVDWDIASIREHGLNETVGCQSGWVYYHTLYKATIVTDFDLVCDRSTMVEVVQSVLSTGTLVGTIIFGPLAESHGRRRPTQIPAVLSLIFVTAAGMASDFYIYLVAQFVVGAAVGGFRVSSVVLATEWMGVTRRGFALCVMQLFTAVGQCTMAALVYAVPDWRTAQYVMAGAQSIVCLYIWWIPESAWWLFGQGRTKEANECICKVAKINKRKVPDRLLKEVVVKQEVQRGGIKEVFTSTRYMKYICIMAFTSFSLSLGYNCVILNVGKYGLNIFLVQFLFGISEIPASLLCIWVLQWIGQKRSLISVALAGGCICLLSLAFPQDSVITITALITTGKFFFNWAVSVYVVYIQALVPTSVRQTAFGLVSMSSKVSALLSPFLNLSARNHPSIPTTVFSSLVLLSGALVFLLPDTTHKELPDSINVANSNRNVNSKTTGMDNNSKSTKL